MIGLMLARRSASIVGRMLSPSSPAQKCAKNVRRTMPIVAFSPMTRLPSACDQTLCSHAATTAAHDNEIAHHQALGVDDQPAPRAELQHKQRARNFKRRLVRVGLVRPPSAQTSNATGAKTLIASSKFNSHDDDDDDDFDDDDDDDDFDNPPVATQRPRRVIDSSSADDERRAQIILFGARCSSSSCSRCSWPAARRRPRFAPPTTLARR